MPIITNTIFTSISGFNQRSQQTLPEMIELFTKIKNDYRLGLSSLYFLNILQGRAGRDQVDPNEFTNTGQRLRGLVLIINETDLLQVSDLGKGACIKIYNHLDEVVYHEEDTPFSNLILRRIQEGLVVEEGR